ncbi:MAG TPA: glycosyltransferase [Ktedonobacterales bacterium]
MARDLSSSGKQMDRGPLRVLTVSGIYPTEERPHSGTYIKSQVDSLVEAGLEIEVLHPGHGPALLRYVSAAARVFSKTLTGSFDVVHGHYGLWCLVARLQWTTPVVASFLGSDLLGDPTATGGDTRKSTLVAHISRWLARRVDAVIVKSEQMRMLMPAENVFVIPNGVDFMLFKPLPRAQARAALGLDPDRYYVLFANDPAIPVKDFPLAQMAIERLRARGVAVELVVANGMANAAVPLYINASNALLLTSKHEGSPNVVKEAMACNIPVVSTDVGDVAQVIGRTAGCAVCQRDPDTLAEALNAALLYPTATTGRADIAHLERSVVARHVIATYTYTLRRATEVNERAQWRHARAASAQVHQQDRSVV